MNRDRLIHAPHIEEHALVCFALCDYKEDPMIVKLMPGELIELTACTISDRQCALVKHWLSTPSSVQHIIQRLNASANRSMHKGKHHIHMEDMEKK